MRDCCWQNYPFGGSFHRPPLCESGRFHSFHVFTHQWCLWKLLWYHGWPVRTMPIMWRLLFSFLECFRAMYGGMLHVHWKSHQWWPGGLWHFHLWLLWCFRRLFQWHVVKLWKLSLRNLPLLKHNKFFCEDLLVPRLPAHVLAKQTLLIPNWFEVIRSGLVLQFTSKEEIFNREFDISLLRKKGSSGGLTWLWPTKKDAVSIRKPFVWWMSTATAVWCCHILMFLLPSTRRLVCLFLSLFGWIEV